MIESALWGAPEWAAAAVGLFVLGAMALVWSYWRSPSTNGAGVLAGMLKIVGLGLLALFLVEPMLRGTRPRTGANLFVVAVDNSQSLTIHDAQQETSRGEELQAALMAESQWQTRLASDFDLRRFEFDTQLRGVKDFTQLDFSGEGSAIGNTLSSLAKRFRGLPTGGILLLTDGNSTDQLPDSIPWSDLPPIYPVLLGGDRLPQDLSVEQVLSTQTNFDAAPVNVRADLRSLGGERRQVAVRLVDEQGTELQSQTVEVAPGDDVLSVRFDLRPTEPGVSFYAIEAVDADQEDPAANEATLANNTRQFLVDRGGGPYRILYVCGRPNWEFKFLRRSLADDDQLELVGLIRIAHREARFDFRRKGDSRTNQLFENFDESEEETQERHDEPVLARIGTADEAELRDGFPKTPDELYQYDALILDDLEADFFTQDQKSLVESFVSRRGGGVLMLGGTESFAEGQYARTPIGNLLPVYLQPAGSAPRASGEELRLSLTREGWLQPWVRLRKTEAEDRQRLAEMPAFQILNQVGLLKPGATPLANVVDQQGREQPALVAQRYGRGRSAALLVGDLWRWGMRRQGTTDDDLGRAWRQMARWLVADVPQRVEVETIAGEGGTTGGVELAIRVSDAEYLPLENASLQIEVTDPDGNTSTLRAEAGQKPGDYRATHVPRTPGAYRAVIRADGPDGAPVGQRATGWIVQPLADEFQRLQPNRDLVTRIADQTGGEVLKLDGLDRFVRSLESREMPITEPWVRPLWYNPWTFTLAILCLCGEWGLRRWKGLA